MKKINYLSFVLLGICLVILVDSCKKEPAGISVRTHSTTLNWYRDSTTVNPSCFLDLYHGKSYTMSQAAAHPDSIDFFLYDRSQLLVSSQTISVVNAIFFRDNNYSVYESFRDHVGILPMSVYNASTMSEVSITATEFNNIRYNSDIDNLFTSKALNGGYTDIDIAAVDLNNTSKYYQFYCEGVNKRGFFHVTGNNYMPGGNMTLEIKVQE